MSKGLINTDLLERLQVHFCHASDLYLVCMDGDKNYLTKTEGEEETVAFFTERIPQTAVNRLIDSLGISSVETIVEEPLDKSYLKLCGIVTRTEGQPALLWIAAGVMADRLLPEDEIPDNIRRTTEERFYRSMALLEEFSRQLLKEKVQEECAEEAIELSRETENKYREQMKRSETMTEVVRLLASEDSFSKLAGDIIERVCQVLQIEGGALLREDETGRTVEVISEYSALKEWNLANRLHGQPIEKVPIMDGKPYMISSDSMMPEELEDFFVGYHLRAGVVQPVEVNEHRNMYLCFYEFEKERFWKVEDIKFINDVKRVLQSILLKRITRNSLAGSYASLEAILENVGCSIYVVDYDNKQVLYINQCFKRLFGMNMDGQKIQEMFFSKPVYEREHGSREFYLSARNRWIEVCQTQITWVDGRKVCLGTVYDITQSKLYQKKIEEQISTDPLTGIYNRMSCEKDLIKMIQEANLTGQEGAYLRIDLDDFQNINQGLGHQYGDTLLKAIAQSLQQIKGVANRCYRVGGDEFGIIVSGEAYKELDRICKDISRIFERPWYLNGRDYFCTMCMGVVCFPTDADNVEDLVRKADMALRTAKKRGKNGTVYYNEKVEATSIYRLDLEKNMRKATLDSCSEFEVYYQPIMDQSKEGTPCCGAEALVRWNSKELGFIPPSDFIPLAEYLGLINQIGEHVMYEAAKRCKYWNDCGHPDYKVNVNLSAVQLLQTDFVQKVKNVLDQTGINPKNLTLEVTESLAIQDMERTGGNLEQIRSLGVHVALDDFGTGYSSLNYIRQMPLDVIKIDRCFVEHLSEDEFSGAFVKMVSELAKTIGVTVCVEGVEERKQLEALKDMNVRLIQGYYYGKPMPVQDFEKIFL